MQIPIKIKTLLKSCRKISPRYITVGVSALTVIICVIIIMSINLESDNMDRIRKVAAIKKPNKNSSEMQIPINFDELKKVNPDIYAWITIPNTDVDYPLLRSEEDFYLTHDVEKKESITGALYTQSYNSDDFNDFNTVIYGHNMLNGSMFGSLSKYRDKKYFDKNQDIIIYTPDKILRYCVFAAYVYDNTHILLNYSLTNIAQKVEYLETIYSGKYGGNLRSELRVTASDKIITLSTCTSKKTERFVVQAVFVPDD